MKIFGINIRTRKQKIAAFKESIAKRKIWEDAILSNATAEEMATLGVKAYSFK